MRTATPVSFAGLLRTAATEPGTINQLLALGQCLARRIQPGPLATFQGWKDKARRQPERHQSGVILPARFCAGVACECVNFQFPNPNSQSCWPAVRRISWELGVGGWELTRAAGATRDPGAYQRQ
jgi:hypothetical protein